MCGTDLVTYLNDCVLVCWLILVNNRVRSYDCKSFNPTFSSQNRARCANNRIRLLHTGRCPANARDDFDDLDGFDEFDEASFFIRGVAYMQLGVMSNFTCFIFVVGI